MQTPSNSRRLSLCVCHCCCCRNKPPPYLGGVDTKQQYDTVTAAAVQGVAPAAQVAEGVPCRCGCITQQHQAPPVGTCPAECELAAALILHLAEHLGGQLRGLLLHPPDKQNR